MEFVFFILAVIILLLIVGIRNSITAKFNALQEKLDQLSIELKKSRSEPVSSPRQEKKSILEGDIFEKPIAASQPIVEKKREETKEPEIKKEEIKVQPETIIFPTADLSAVHTHSHKATRCEGT